MLAKLDIRDIIANHFQTLKDYGSTRYNRVDVVLFYGVPAVASVILIILGFTISDEIANILITSLSIFAALLLNLLLMIFDTLRKMRDSGSPELGGVRKELLQQTYANISYSILISLVSVFVLMGFAVWNISVTGWWVILLQKVASLLVYFLTINFLLTLFMVLKRINRLLSKELDT
jgi:hypothetical protein